MDSGLIQLTRQTRQARASDQANRNRYPYKSSSIKDGQAINAKTGKPRAGQAKPLQLQTGKYLFRVTNKNVAYELGFWLRGASTAARLTLPSVSGGGLLPGRTKDYEIDLKPGEYLYSCPLNTTPDYKLVVK